MSLTEEPPHTSPQRPPETDVRGLASSLGPVLVDVCEGRLDDIRWFRADWQRGGAATAHATYRDDSGQPRPVVIKLPVSVRELRWTRRLQSEEGVVPRLYASGDSLGGYDLAWIIIEELPFGPLGSTWDDGCVPRIAAAAAGFYKIASQYEIDADPVREDWDELVKGAREALQRNATIPNQQKWVATLKTVQSRLDRLVEVWRARPIEGWVHGDLHPANALCRTSEPDAPVALIDLAEVRPGHWIEDAVYLERLHWARPERIRKHKPVKAIVQARKKFGLPTGGDYQRLAAVRRVLLAATAPRFLKSEGNPAYLESCLSRLESSLNDLKAAGV